MDAGTHYCDLTGEFNFVQDMIAAYHEVAKAKGCKIVHSCGFDSIPSDITALVLVDYLKQKHKVATEYVEYVLRGMKATAPCMSRKWRSRTQTVPLCDAHKKE